MMGALPCTVSRYYRDNASFNALMLNENVSKGLRQHISFYPMWGGHPCLRSRTLYLPPPRSYLYCVADTRAKSTWQPSLHQCTKPTCLTVLYRAIQHAVLQVVKCKAPSPHQETKFPYYTSDTKNGANCIETTLRSLFWRLDHYFLLFGTCNWYRDRNVLENVFYWYVYVFDIVLLAMNRVARFNKWWRKGSCACLRHRCTWGFFKWWQWSWRCWMLCRPFAFQYEPVGRSVRGNGSVDTVPTRDKSIVGV